MFPEHQKRLPLTSTPESVDSSQPQQQSPQTDLSQVRTGPVIALLVVSAFIVILNETIMGVAIPRLMTDLEITASTAQWLSTAFMLTMAIIIPLTGFLLQRFTVRTMFFTAMALFSTGTLVAASSVGFEILLLGRVIQACGTAIMMPLLMTTVLNIVPAEKRGRMMGLISVVISVAPATGPTVSGIILEHLNWRWMFWLVLPIALLAIALGAIWVKNVTETKRVGFDAVSVVLAALGFGGLIFGLSMIGEDAEDSAVVPFWIPTVIGIAAIALFIWRQLQLQQRDSALLDLRVFTSRQFSLAIALVTVTMGALFGSLILLPMFLQQVLSLTPLETGLMMLPGGLLMGLIAPLIGYLFDKFGPVPLVIPGMIIATLALWGMAGFDQHSEIAWIIAVMMSLNLGLGMVFTPLLTSALGSLPRQLYPHGSAIVGTVQQVAGAAGTAVFITIMAVQAASGLSQGMPELAAQAYGFHQAFLVGAIVATVAAIFAFFVRKPKQTGTVSHGH